MSVGNSQISRILPFLSHRERPTFFRVVPRLKYSSLSRQTVTIFNYCFQVIVQPKVVFFVKTAFRIIPEPQNKSGIQINICMMRYDTVIICVFSGYYYMAMLWFKFNSCSNFFSVLNLP